VIIQEPDSIAGFVVASATTDVRCFGDSDGRITIDWNGGNPGPATYTWSPNVSTDSVATDLAPGIYSITITDRNGCSNVLVHEVLEPSPIAADLPTPEPIACNGDRTELVVLGAAGGNGPDYYYTINNGSRLEIGSGLEVLAGNYTISVFDQRGCRFDTSLTIQQPGELTVGIAQAPEARVNLGEMIELTGFTQGPNPISTIEWTPAVNLSAPDQLVTKAMPDRTEIYTLTVVDENGCVASATIRLIVEAIRKVFIPNAFTPNDDGLNDVFGVSTGFGVEAIEAFEVYNRWGDRVFGIFSPIPASNNPVVGWDGTFNGRLLDPGVFAYKISIRFADNTVIHYQGDVTLMR
jgi:gliding motility-associated-like protein